MTDIRSKVEALRQRATPAPDTATAWHTYLTAASQAIRPVVFDERSLRHRADLLRNLKAASHSPPAWRDYLTCLNTDRKQSVRQHNADPDLHIRMYQSLQALYEHATRLVPMSAANRHSPVYLQLWLDLAALRAEDDLDDANVIFKHLKSHRIGQNLPLFWNAWSDLEKRRKNPERAARFRREAETCAATSSTPARNASSSEPAVTPRADHLLSGQRSARRAIPLRPPRRVIKPTTTPVARQDSDGINNGNVATVQTPTASESMLVDAGCARPGAGAQTQPPRLYTETAMAPTPDPALHSEKRPPLRPITSAIASPEMLRSQQKATARSPPQLFSSPEDMASGDDIQPKSSSSSRNGVDSPSSGETDRHLRHETGSAEPQGITELDRIQQLRQVRELQSGSESESVRRNLESERVRQAQLRREHADQLDVEKQRTRASGRRYPPALVGLQDSENKYGRHSDSEYVKEQERQRELERQRRVNARISAELRYASERAQSRSEVLTSRQEQDGEAFRRHPNGPLSAGYAEEPHVGRRSAEGEREEWNGRASQRQEVFRKRRSEDQHLSSEEKRDGHEEENRPPRVASSSHASGSGSPSTLTPPKYAGEHGSATVRRSDKKKLLTTQRALLTKFLGSIEPESLVTVNGKPYLILEMVGKGGSSKVFKVLSSEMRIVALKRVKVPRSASFQATIDSYANEIALLQQLRGCPTIIQLFDAEVHRDDGMILLIMEYGDVDLAKLLSRGKSPGVKINGNFRRVYWQQMLEAVHTIHEARIIHGDLKPANFLIVAGTLKLIDFGIAKAIQADDTTKIFRDSQVGTPNYMSPEALLCDDDGDDSTDDPVGHDRGRSSKPRRYKVGRASDIWSLGCILYQMVYGRAPFAHIKNVMMKLNCIQNPNYDIPFRPVEDDSVLDVLEGCLQRDPDRRMTIPELLKHGYICLEGNKRRRQTDESGGEHTATLVDSRVMVGSVVEQLHRRGFDEVCGPRAVVSLRRGDEACETLVSDIARVMPSMTAGGTGTESGLSGRKDRLGHPWKGLRTPTVSAVTPHTGTHGSEKQYL